MEQRHFGSSGLVTSALGMGCSRLGSFLNESGPREAVATVALAIESGISFFDTSDLYAQGDSERLLGKALRGKRNNVLVATKAGRRFSGRAQLAAYVKRPIRAAMRLLPVLKRGVQRSRSSEISLDFSPAYLMGALEMSLRRLGSEWVDVFMLHSPPAEVFSDENLFRQLTRMRDQGKVRCIGVSVAEPAHVPLAMSLPGVQAIQVPIGLPHAAANGVNLPQATKRGIGIVGREVFEGLAQPLDAESTGRALRTALGMHDVAVVLIGMSSREHLRSNLRAAWMWPPIDGR